MTDLNAYTADWLPGLDVPLARCATAQHTHLTSRMSRNLMFCKLQMAILALKSQVAIHALPYYM